MKSSTPAAEPAPVAPESPVVAPRRVTVVIPCFKQAHFLDDAITSILRQTYRDFEVVVVDDGSPDNPSQVVARYPDAICIRQANRGQPTARNVGFSRSRGEFIVFLDADDRLLPDALEVGVSTLRAHPHAAFVFGGCSLIAADGSPLPFDWSAPDQTDHYAALLRENSIITPGTVMFRRGAIETHGGFNTRLRASEDYKLYLRIARRASIFCHGRIVVEHRTHETNLTKNYLATWPSALAVRLWEWKYARRTSVHADAYRVGFRRFVDYNISGVFRAAVSAFRRGDLPNGVRASLLLVLPPRIAWHSLRKLVRLAARSVLNPVDRPADARRGSRDA
jgi:glycosyltransferase involved in cell wall biosynthesis